MQYYHQIPSDFCGSEERDYCPVLAEWGSLFVDDTQESLSDGVLQLVVRVNDEDLAQDFAYVEN